MKYLVFICFTVSLLVIEEAHGRDSRGTKLAVSQGISSPTITSPVNFSHGMTFNNSAVAAQLQDIYVSAEADTGDDDNGNDDTGFGGELGLGNGTAGIALGYYKRDCEDCDGRLGGIAGIGGDSVAFGVGFREEDTYSAGLLFNPRSQHRFGFTADFYKNDLDEESDLRSYGAGYSYVGNSFIFALDASKRDSENDNPNDDVIMVTPGLEVHGDWLALSVSYDAYVNDDNDTHDDDIWVGVGINGKSWNLALYHDYVNEWSAALTFWF